MKKLILFLVIFSFVGATFAQDKGTKVKKSGVTLTASKSGGYTGPKSFLNQKAPKLVIQKWKTEEPDTVGKFILLEIYGYFCPPCKAIVPTLNEFSKKFKKNMVVIGLSSDAADWKDVKIEYYKAVDRERTTYKELNLIFVPYSLLIDPKGIVRWEGSPDKLTEELIKGVIKKYK